MYKHALTFVHGVQRVNVYCPEVIPGPGTIVHPGVQQKKFLPFGHGRDLAAFKTHLVAVVTYDLRALSSNAPTQGDVSPKRV